MPLDLAQVPTDDLVNALNKRYPNLVLAGCSEAFIEDHVADCFYVQGNILTAMGLWAIMQDHLMQGFRDNIEPDRTDAP